MRKCRRYVGTAITSEVIALLIEAIHLETSIHWEEM